MESIKDSLNELDALDERYRAEFRRAASEHLRPYVEHVTDAVPRFGGNAYVCPCCGSGTGVNGHYTPAFFLFRKRDGEMAFKCQSCGVTGNIFALAGLVNHVGRDQEMRIVADFLGVDLARRTPLSVIEAQDGRAARPRTRIETLRLKQKARDHIARCRGHADETDFFAERGLSPDTVERFGLGYDPERQMAVIPFSGSYYMERSTRVGADCKDAGKHRKPKGLRQPLFNLPALSSAAVFVTEAPLDAISIVQSGGAAVALGGTSTAALGKVLDVYRPKCRFILCFDGDDRGKAAQERLSEMLAARGIPHAAASHPAFSSHKDANAVLMADPGLLREAVRYETERALSDLEAGKRAAGRPATAEYSLRTRKRSSRRTREAGGR